MQLDSIGSPGTGIGKGSKIHSFINSIPGFGNRELLSIDEVDTDTESGYGYGGGGGKYKGIEGGVKVRTETVQWVPSVRGTTFQPHPQHGGGGVEASGLDLDMDADRESPKSSQSQKSPPLTGRSHTQTQTLIQVPRPVQVLARGSSPEDGNRRSRSREGTYEESYELRNMAGSRASGVVIGVGEIGSGEDRERSLDDKS